MKTGDALERRLADSVDTSLNWPVDFVGVLTEDGKIAGCTAKNWPAFAAA